MFMTKIKLIGTAALAVILTATGATLLAQREAAAPVAAAAAQAARGNVGREGGGDLRGIVRAVDAAQSTLTLAAPPSRDGTGTPDRTLAVAKDAEVFLDEGSGRRMLAREGKLADLAPGAIVILRLSADQKTIEAILAEGPT